MIFLDMFKEANLILTTEEENFLKEFQPSFDEVEQAKVMIEMYSIKHAERNTLILIDSNKELAKSTEKHTKAMRYLTGALVFVAVAQVVVASLAILLKL